MKKPGSRQFKAQIVIASVLLLALLAMCVPRLFDCRWVVVQGESVNVRFGMVDMRPDAVNQGDYVVLQWTGHDPNGVPHLTPGRRLVKKVGCAPGQHLEVNEREVRCDGSLLGLVREKSLGGKTLKPALYNGKIEEWFYFLVGEHEASYDSRYLGLFRKKDIVGKFLIAASL